MQLKQMSSIINVPSLSCDAYLNRLFNNLVFLKLHGGSSLDSLTIVSLKHASDVTRASQTHEKGLQL
jgi:hypothetical protein